MRNAAILLAAVAGLYLLPSIAIKAVYGPSYTFPPSEDCWKPDGSAGWVQHGAPTVPPPSSPSVNVPIVVQYLPIFLPGILLALFMFGPWSKKLQDPLPVDDENEAGGDEGDPKTDS